MRAIVTAGANGLGRATSICLAKQNFKVLSIDIDKSSCDELQKLSDNELNGNIITEVADVGNPDIPQQCVNKAIDLFGGINVLVNNAGINNSKPILLHEFDYQWWQRIMSVNLTSTFLFSKYCIQQFFKEKEEKKQDNDNYSIVNIASIHATASHSGVSCYAASKGAIISLTQQMAIEYGNKNIRINCISPGTIETPQTMQIINDSGSTKQDVAKLYPLQRIGKPDDIAEMVSFLVSDKGSFITGENINIDGGILRKAAWRNV